MLRFILSSAVIALASGCMGTNVPDLDNPKSASDSAACELPGSAAVMCDELLEQINLLRADAGLAPLIEDATLDEVADDFACRMVSDDFFSHDDPESLDGPGDRLIDAGYLYFAMGENLAAGQVNVNEVLSDWMASPAHRANILTPEWRETGLAVRNGGRYGAYWVQEFAEPVDLSATAEPADPYALDNTTDEVPADDGLETDTETWSATDAVDKLAETDPATN